MRRAGIPSRSSLPPWAENLSIEDRSSEQERACGIDRQEAHDPGVHMVPHLGGTAGDDGDSNEPSQADQNCVFHLRLFPLPMDAELLGTPRNAPFSLRHWNTLPPKIQPAKKSSPVSRDSRLGADGLGRDVSQRGGLEKAAHIAAERTALDAAGAAAGRDQAGER